MTQITDTQRRTVQETVIEPMIHLYGQRFADSPDAAAGASRQYIEDLGEFSKAVLDEAWRTVRRTHKGRQWPTPAVLRQACFDEQAAADAKRAKAVRTPGKGRDWSAVRARRDAFLRVYEHSPLAQQAKAEGWWDQLETRVKAIAWYQAQILERWDHADSVNPHAEVRRYPDQIRRDFYLDDLALQNTLTAPLSERDIAACIGRARSQEAAWRSRPKALQGAPVTAAAALPSVTRDALAAPRPASEAEATAALASDEGPVGPEPPPAEAEFAPGAGPV